MEAQTYNAVFTLHGVIMIFLVVIPSIPAAFGNIILPIHLGAEDVAFPKLNLFSFWLYLTGAALAILSLFSGDGRRTQAGHFMSHSANLPPPM